MLERRGATELFLALKVHDTVIDCDMQRPVAVFSDAPATPVARTTAA